MNNKVMALDLILRRPLARVAVWLLLAAGTVYAATAAADNTMGTAVDELGRISTQIVRSAWRSEQGIESTFPELAGQVEQFDAQKDRLDSSRLAAQLSQLEVSWQPVKRAAQALVEAGPDITFVHSLAAGYQREMDSMQREFAQVASLTRARNGTGATTAVAQQNLWLNERISRNIHRVLAGDPASEQAAQALRADSDELLRNIEALTRGDAARGIDKLVDPAAIENLSSAFRKFSPISTAVDRIVGSAGELREAAASRELILSSGDSLGESIAALRSAVNGLAVSAPAQDGVLTPLLLVLLLLSLCLCGYQFLLRRRSAGQLGQGMTSINTALQKLGEGDLAQRIEEKGGPMAEVAAKINHTAQRQYELVENIRAPFDRALEEINTIGISAQGLVEKGNELTRSVGESSKAAIEMVRASEEIKRSSAEAMRTSERNCQQVAQGYGLTKDMSKASADVRESVQETSKSAKRQGELIQSVTAAAEYIQALNTKISVVAINTRIEAEKAGEYGRPFLGIAEAIADLLREAGEEGRKIISEVRMLQNMSAENLSSMENTVGTVVTILEYIERLDSSLEEINSGSAGISAIIHSVDDAAGLSAVNALHMKSSMTQIRERNQEIVTCSQATQRGVSSLQRTLRDASESLGKFRAAGEGRAVPAGATGELESIGIAPRVYREEDMSALESSAARSAVHSGMGG